jgi:hypothetical protein
MAIYTSIILRMTWVPELKDYRLSRSPALKLGRVRPGRRNGPFLGFAGKLRLC